jgi:hypothetical protein
LTNTWRRVNLIAMIFETAFALGPTIPEAMLDRADEVFE